MPGVVNEFLLSFVFCLGSWLLALGSFAFCLGSWFLALLSFVLALGTRLLSITTLQVWFSKRPIVILLNRLHWHQSF